MKEKEKNLISKPMHKRVRQALEKWAKLLNYDFKDFKEYYRHSSQYNLPIDVRVIISKLKIALHLKKDKQARLQARKSLERIEKEFQKLNQKGGSKHERPEQT